MSDYRTATPTESTSEPPSFEKSTEGTINTTDVTPPYSEYEAKNGKPYSVDYFDLGRYWNQGELYTAEIGSIETYLNHLVNTGEVNNTTEAIEGKLKKIEKMINSDPTDRKANRVQRLAAYVEFLIKSDNIKKTTAKSHLV